MKCHVGIGSNLGERRRNLESAARLIGLCKEVVSLRPSPIVETPALLPLGAPRHWQQPFLNAVVQIDWQGSPVELLRFLKRTETEMGREAAPRWAPRLVDLDLLTFGDNEVREMDLVVPHAEIWQRQFVLAPLKHLQPSLSLTGRAGSVLARSRALKGALPLWMGILNVTPDSFSGDGLLSANYAELEARLARFEEANTQILDIGAESTRPGAQPLAWEEEWKRLHPVVEFVNARYRGSIFRPWISVDTYHAATAVRAIEAGVDIVNDVSGGRDPALLEVLRWSQCQYVLMHSLTVPAAVADGSAAIAMAADPVVEIMAWASSRLAQLQAAGIDLDRVIVDPGIGFGKSASQSWRIIEGIEEFSALPTRVLIGHSRKSFLAQRSLAEGGAGERDWESVGVSLRLAEKGVDILRIHRPDLHQRAWRAFQEAR